MADVHGSNDDVILYDGVCIFCSRWVRFVAKRDVARKYRFTPIQSDYGQRLAATFGIDTGNPDTNAVTHQGHALMKSDAALSVLSHLPHFRWVRALAFVPRPLRDAIYNLIARNRYRIFGRTDACFTGDASFRDRIIT